MIYGFCIGNIAKVLCLFADLFDNCLIVFVDLEVGFEGDYVMYKDDEHIAYHGEQQLVILRVNHARVDQLNKKPSPVYEIARVFLQIICSFS